MAKTAETAASTALPPRASTVRATREAAGDSVTTMPARALTAGRKRDPGTARAAAAPTGAEDEGGGERRQHARAKPPRVSPLPPCLLMRARNPVTPALALQRRTDPNAAGGQVTDPSTRRCAGRAGAGPPTAYRTSIGVPIGISR